MEFDKIKELINIIDSSDLAFLEIKTSDSYIKMDKSLNRNLDNSGLKQKDEIKEANINEKISYAQEEKQKLEQLDNNIEDNDLKEDITIITSPMVGTFYSSASPESEAFIKEGDIIKKGQVICIIEAMKLMNEIESDYSGKVIKCLLQNGDMVEYGQKLFEIRGE
ncbi:acetyl-CoA carboxylase biotin carboxyl carrier protein [Clostridium uliginosum]|uniref:Biotin carboxyl carrier protein of acetyl-CoA carboxylase n=1 Tax=Clostridium uliginosum TaxID=119641 RepID=A0A1I1S010_9CLOT|nr:acetyl-CoA carboxylase biotin carboxyl carrier protein [Clostridium uliginosum]SFD39899.1 acetyl-CoA carboxylase biotin carboxyl carrier protein [Clostridium uliginosum]